MLSLNRWTTTNVVLFIHRNIHFSKTLTMFKFSFLYNITFEAGMYVVMRCKKKSIIQ